MKRISCFLSVLMCCLGIALACATPAFADTYNPIVVTLGDSYAAGEGVEPYYGQFSWDKYSNQDWLAHRSSNSWSSQLVIGGTKLGDVRAVPSSGDGSLEEGRPEVYYYYGYPISDEYVSMKYFYLDEFTQGTWFDVACSHAVMNHVYRRDARGYQTKFISNETYALNRIEFYAVHEPQIAVFDYIDSTYGKNSVDYVLLQVGGFDFDYPFTVFSATATVDALEGTEELTGMVQKAKDRWYSRSRDSYEDMLYAIREAAGSQAKIIIVGYPEIFNGADANRIITPSGINLTYSQSEMDILDDLMRFIDAEVTKLIAELQNEGFENLYYVSTINAFKGHGAYTDDSYIYPMISPALPEDTDKTDGDEYPMSLMSIKSLHPNEVGTSVIASLVQELIDSIEIAEGRMHKVGWNKDADGYCYYEDGYTRRVNGWATYNGSYYYLGDNGTVLTSSWVRYNDKYYYVGANGKAQANTWVKYNGSYYYLNSKGNPTVNGWVKYKGSYYYMGANGKPTVNGWVKYNGNYYYMGSNGKPTVNAWVTYKGSQYYFNEKGVCTKKK